MDVQIRLHRWVLRWFYVSVALGAFAIANIVGRDLTRAQEHIILFMGVVNWVLGGLVCYACDAIRIETPSEAPADEVAEAPKGEQQIEWRPASEFLFSGDRKSILPPKY